MKSATRAAPFAAAASGAGRRSPVVLVRVRLVDVDVPKTHPIKAVRLGHDRVTRDTTPLVSYGNCASSQVVRATSHVRIA